MEIHWTICLKEPNNTRLELTDEEAAVLISCVCPGGWEAALGPPLHPYFIASQICQMMLDDYLYDDEERNKNEPLQPQNGAEQIALKVIYFVPSSEHPHTMPSHPEDFEQAKKNTALLITKAGQAVNTRKYSTT
jgi:hypothetical protein